MVEFRSRFEHGCKRDHADTAEKTEEICSPVSSQLGTKIEPRSAAKEEDCNDTLPLQCPTPTNPVSAGTQRKPGGEPSERQTSGAFA